MTRLPLAELERAGGREWCAACGKLRDRGALLRVADHRGARPPAALCRPGLYPGCLGWAGTAQETAIGLLDPDAAREFDRAQAAQFRRDGTDG